MDTSQFGDQLDSIHSISVEIASLRELPDIYDRTLTYSLALTSSDLSFLGLLSESKDFLELPAVKGTFPFDLDFYDRFHHMPVRDSVFGVTLTQRRSHISNDVAHDPHRVGQPTGHPPVGMFLGVPLRVGDDVIGMVGVANKPGGYTIDDERLLSTFANQVVVAIDNARLYRRQREIRAVPIRLGAAPADARRGQRSRADCLTLIKLDERRAFRGWAATARVAATEADDPATYSWVLAQEAYGHFYGDDFREAVRVARQAQVVAPKTPSVGAVLAAALEARALGVLGRADETHAALREAERILLGLDDATVAASAFGYDEAQLRFP